MNVLRLAAPVVVVLIGPSGSGKSTWAAEQFTDSEVVSADRFRSIAGVGEADLSASADAFELVRQVLAMRCKRGLTSVVDTLGFDAELREWLVSLGAEHQIEVHAVVFDTPAPLCRERNAQRAKRVSAAVLATQLKTFRTVREAVSREPFTAVHTIAPTPSLNLPATADEPESRESPGDHIDSAHTKDLRFGLHLSSFPGPSATLAERLSEWAVAAEEVGFDSLWVMDHFRQIPQVGREWDDMPESIATLNFLAARTSRVTLGGLVHCVTHRNLGVLGKSLATLDVLSGGRAVCGLGLGWFAAEHAAYGLEFPTTNARYALLEDALRFLPLLWGKGAPSYEGSVFSAPQAFGYPRPLQARIPILVGGGGERRTLRLAAQYADACNLFGDADAVRHKVAALQRHCLEVERDPALVSVTHLGTAMVGTSPQDLAERLQASRASARQVKAWNPGTIDDHLARACTLHEAGVDHLIVSLPDISVDAISRFGRVIASVRSG